MLFRFFSFRFERLITISQAEQEKNDQNRLQALEQQLCALSVQPPEVIQQTLQDGMNNFKSGTVISYSVILSLLLRFLSFCVVFTSCLLVLECAPLLGQRTHQAAQFNEDIKHLIQVREDVGNHQWEALQTFATGAVQLLQEHNASLAALKEKKEREQQVRLHSSAVFSPFSFDVSCYYLFICLGKHATIRNAENRETQTT